jgi:hypothetical protein
MSSKNIALKGQCKTIGDFNPLPFQGEIYTCFYPPRCGGLLRFAPKGAEENLQYYCCDLSKTTNND